MGLKRCWQEDYLEAGVDEAGRGCLAGPVVAAAVILPDSFTLPLLDDSKKLSASQRAALRPEIERKAMAYHVAFVDNHEIDRINILQASVRAMHLALEGLNVSPEHVLVDGNYFIPWRFIPYRTVVKGDGKYMNIAAASILAKTYRDDYMIQLHDRFPHYSWDTNMGYPTSLHREGIRRYGTTSFHRMSFDLLGEKKKVLHDKG